MAGRIAYYGNIVKDGLVLALDAAKKDSYPGSGTVWRDVSGNGYTGSLTNGPTFDISNGGGIVFDGTNDYVNSSFINPYSETIIVWAKSNTTTWNKYGWISSSRRQNGHIIHPEFSGTRQLSFYILNSSAGFTLIGSTTPADITVPHMYTYSTNGSNSHKCYIDDTFITENTTSIIRTTTPTSQIWYLGLDDFPSDPNRYGNGVIYDVLRYNRQLSNSEVTQNYNALKGRFGL
jgi:hypothetical protein